MTDEDFSYRPPGDRDDEGREVPPSPPTRQDQAGDRGPEPPSGSSPLGGTPGTAPPGATSGGPGTVDDLSGAPTAPEGPGPVPAGSAEAPVPPPRPRDPNLDAIARAGLEADMDHWLREVAAQVDPRLDRVAPGWRGGEQSGAARACVFGLMLGRLANDYPHTSGDLARVAEAHPSFATLPTGTRLATLREIADDRSRGAAWIAPLVGLGDPSPLQDILD